MNEFNQLFHQAVAIKSSEMSGKRKTFEKQPMFVKTGLYYLNQYQEHRTKPFPERFALSSQLKEKGNNYFAEANYAKASHEYEQSLSIFRYIQNKNPNWKNQGILDEDLTYIEYHGENEEEKQLLKDHKIKLYLNLAACYLKEKMRQDAIKVCDEALLLDEKLPKAYFRRSKVRTHPYSFLKARTTDINAEEKEYEEAIKDLEKALIYDPDNFELKKELHTVQKELKKMKRQSQQLSQAIMTPMIESNQTNKENDTEEEKKNKEQEHQKEQNKLVLYEDEYEEEDEDDEYSEEWKEKEFNSINYELSYEVDPSRKVPEEVVELGIYITKQVRGYELLRIFETTGKKKEAEKLKEQLEVAMKAKEQLEKISRMDFERPIGKMRDVASGFGVDLGDELVKEQFQELQERNLKDIRIWLRKNGWKDIKRRRKKRERRGEGRTDIAQEMILEQAVENMNTDSEVADKESRWEKVATRAVLVVCVALVLLVLLSKLKEVDL